MAAKKADNKGNGKSDAKGDAKGASKVKAMTKSAVVQHLSTETKLSKKQVLEVFDKLSDLIRQQLGKKGPGVFTLPGLLKLKKVHKPATKERKGIHPITKLETTFAAKPARNMVRRVP